VVAAMSVSAPAYRFRGEDVHRPAPRLLTAAASVSDVMGHPRAVSNREQQGTTAGEGRHP
jgi:hypothetical protein